MHVDVSSISCCVASSAWFLMAGSRFEGGVISFLPEFNLPLGSEPSTRKACATRSPKSRVHQKIAKTVGIDWAKEKGKAQSGPDEAASQNAELKARGSKCAAPTGQLATKIMPFQKENFKTLIQNRSSSASHLWQKQCVGYGRTKGNARVAEHVE